MADQVSFTEKQYLGRDYNRISVRLTMALFCFGAYYLSSNKERTAEVLVLVGIAILIGSVVMLFMVHYRTTVRNKSIIIDGLWTTRLVKIDLNSIVKIERTKYSAYLINNPVYNLHTNGKIKFYAGGKEALTLTDRDGLEYVIGTQCPEEFELALRNEMNKD